jgi:hypothetical protein
MKDEREMMSGPSHEKNHGAEGPRGRLSRRGFLGQTTALLAAAFAGIWSLAAPKRARALNEPGSSTTGAQQLRCPPNQPCSPPPPPPNYTTQSLALINKVIAAYNVHNASGLVSYMDSATIDTALLATHLAHNFAAFPQTSITANSMTAGPFGYSVTLNWTIHGTYTTPTADNLVNANGVNPTQTDAVTGSTVFYISTGSFIYEMDTTHNIPPVFSAHGATVL